MAKKTLRFPAACSLDSVIHPRSWVIFLGESELVRASVLPIFVILARRYDLRGALLMARVRTSLDALRPWGSHGQRD